MKRFEPSPPIAGLASAPRTLVDMLRARVCTHSERAILTFLADGETAEVTWTYAQLDTRARAIAATLQAMGVAGERALLLYLPGLEYIAAFFGCLYAGVTAVPAYPPDPLRLPRTLPRLQALVHDARAAVALTTSDVLALTQAAFAAAPDLQQLRWVATDQIESPAAARWEVPHLAADDLAFLQYTSGSTGAPRGVMLSHANVLHNIGLIREALEADESYVVVSWLPPYHDMGLIGFILAPLATGSRAVLMSPLAFLQRPIRWLQAIHRFGAHGTAGPSFAYELCLKRSTAEQRAALDLGSVRSAGCGAEPVRHRTLRRFTEAFAASGFRWNAFYPCYGLAEATLLVTGGTVAAPPLARTLRRAALARHRLEATVDGDAQAQTFVGCGPPRPSARVEIVDPVTRRPCPADAVGEIWVSSPGVGQGYWGRAEETAHVFEAHLADGEGPFLRTGDLGFLADGELFITGRLKNLIIVDGAKHYAEDIEHTAERSHPAVRPGCGAAFALDVDGSERLVVIHEIDVRSRDETAAALTAIRTAIGAAHEIQPLAVVLISRGTLPKTSSGKVQRPACRAAFADGSLEVVAESRWCAAKQGT